MVRNFIVRAICRQSSYEGVRQKIIWEMGPEEVASVRLRKEQRVERRQGIHYVIKECSVLQRILSICWTQKLETNVF